MAFGAATINDFGGAIGDLFAAGGEDKAAKSYKQAAKVAQQNEDLSKESTALQEFQTNRKIYQTVGGQQADIAGAGFAESGSALDLLRSSAEQGALTRAQTGIQGSIDVNAYEEQRQAYLGEASSESAASKGSGASGLLGIIGGIASIFL